MIGISRIDLGVPGDKKIRPDIRDWGFDKRPGPFYPNGQDEGGPLGDA